MTSPSTPSVNEQTQGPHFSPHCNSLLGENPSEEVDYDNYYYYYWASEASPTLGCSIEISRDICIYICVSVVVQKA